MNETTAPPELSDTDAPPTVFAAVPFVQVHRPFQLGPWRLWSNTKADWMRETGRDYTEFMTIYRGRQGEPVEHRGSVLTRTGDAEPTREEFHRAIHAFSTLAWLNRQPSADPWLFEVWRLPADYKRRRQREFYSRVSKFHHNRTSDDYDRVHASPYTYPFTLRADLPDELVSFFAAELAKADPESLLRSLGQFHAARFDSPYFSSYGNDIEALWSAFEAWFLPEDPTTSKKRNERLSEAIWAELQLVSGIEPRLQEALDDFCLRLWRARNGHSHAGQEPTPDDAVAYERGLLGIGLELAATMLKIRAFRANDWFIAELVGEVYESFFRIPRIREALTLLKKLRKPEEWFDSVLASAEKPAVLVRLAPVLKDVVNFENVEGFRGDADARAACAAMGRVLSRWIGHLASIEPTPDGFELISGLPLAASEALARLKEENKSGNELVEALNEERVEFLKSGDAWRAGGELDPSAKCTLGGEISLWYWVRGCIRMHELFLGHREI